MSMPPRSRTGSGPVVAGLIIAAIVAVGVIVLAAAGATPTSVWNSFFPVHNEGGVTDRSQSVQSLYDIVFYIAVVIFLLVEGLIAWSAFRYRRKPGDTELPPQTHGNNLVEVMWTIIPTAIVLFLFLLSWQTLNTVEAKVPADVHVRAVAARFQWSFEYLDGQAADAKVLFTQALPVGDTGGLVLPVGEPVTIDLRSQDVIHAFYVPKFLFKRDVVPGKTNTFNFTVDEPGTYRGQCAELCGAFHGSMLFEVHAIAKADFDTWLADQIAKANATPAPAPSGAAAGPTVELGALNVAFSTNALQAPAGSPFTIHFKNDDASIPHNVEIKDASGAVAFKGDIITGVAETNYAVPALKAGTYTFVCTVHPNMTGTLTVQ
ncbi:MAG TPA: cytochrome c oxidase subunit II [Candidatus Limnocylindrales bacterium]|nr:cytochrome c oxidase subunit II [Candidatus Limnocylindrales bacterium]